MAAEVAELAVRGREGLLLTCLSVRTPFGPDDDDDALREDGGVGLLCWDETDERGSRFAFVSWG